MSQGTAVLFLCDPDSIPERAIMPVEILVVEDNPSDAVLIKKALSEFSPGVRITVAKDADTAVALLFDPGFRPQLVITDITRRRAAQQNFSVVLTRSVCRCGVQFRVESSRSRRSAAVRHEGVRPEADGLERVSRRSGGDVLQVDTTPSVNVIIT